MKLLTLLIVPVLLSAASVTLRAQDVPVPIIRAETRLVNVPVNVTDAHGAPIGDLQQADFTILENGRPQKIANFEKDVSTPLSMVMAVDTSESVISQFNTERDAARRFIRNMLREQDEMDLISFSDSVSEIVSFTNKAQEMERGLNRLQPGDATALYDTVYLSSQRLMEARKDATRRRVLVLITDGGDTTKGVSYTKAVEEAQRAGTAIYPIIIMPILSDAGRNVAGEHALIQMSEDTGGKFFYVRDKGDLDKAFAHLSDDLRTQYLLSYYAPPRGHDASLRAIEVRIANPQQQALRLRYRTAYFPDSR